MRETMASKRTKGTTRRQVLKLSATSGFVAGTTSLAAGQRVPTSQVHLIETGLTFQSIKDVGAELRMPVDNAPKYRTVADGIVPTRFATATERRRFQNADRIISNGRIHGGGTFRGPTGTNRLPLKLWNGRQPIDAVRVAETVEEPKYTITSEGSDAIVSGAGTTTTVPSGKTSEVTFSERRFSILNFERVGMDDSVTDEFEGEEARYEYEERSYDYTFVPTLRIHNRGTVNVHVGGAEK